MSHKCGPKCKDREVFVPWGSKLRKCASLNERLNAEANRFWNAASIKVSLVSFYFRIPSSGWQKRQKWFRGISGLRDRCLGNASLAAGTFDHVCGGVALAGFVLWIISALRGLQVERGAAEQVLLQVVE